MGDFDGLYKSAFELFWENNTLYLVCKLVVKVYGLAWFQGTKG